MSAEQYAERAIPYPHAAELVSHWWWRPGWTPGTQWYAWHFTLEGQPELHRLAAAYQAVLRDLGSLDLIPAEWLHITVQGLGSVDAVPANQCDRIYEAVAERLSVLPAPIVTFRHPVLHREAVVLPPTRPEPLQAIREVIRSGISDVWGAGAVPESSTYRPHFSLAYVNRDESPSVVINRLEEVHCAAVSVRLTAASLISLRREDSCYKWTTLRSARFA